MPELRIEVLPTSDLIPYANNAKLHSLEQVDQIAASISEFGNCDPIGVWHNENGEPEIVEGHGRLMALNKLGIEQAPVIFLDHLSDEQRRAYSIVHNQTNLSSGFDMDVLNVELDDIVDIDMSQWGLEIESFEPSFGDADDERTTDESVTVRVTFHDQSTYQRYRQAFSEMEDDGASVSIS